MSEASEPVPASSGQRMRTWRWILLGLATVTIAFGGAGGWGATVPIASAVIASGQVTVDTNRKSVQHLEGGIVNALHMRDGDFVHAGDVLVTLDDTRARASLAIVAGSYREELAKEARYIAERDGLDAIVWPADLHGAQDDPAIAKILDSQTTIFDARRETLNGETSILQERISQLEQEIQGLTAQQRATERQIELIGEELEVALRLLELGQTTKPRVLALQRESARLDGQKGELIANIARAHNTIGETRLEMIQNRKAFHNDVVAALREVQAEVNDLRERFVAAEDVLQRLEIRAPASGKVVNLAVHSQDAVIQPGDTILEIVPSDDRLLVEVRVQPQDVDNVALGQASEVRVLAFSQRKAPTMIGAVTYVSADALTNPQDGSTFYVARVAVPDDQLAQLEGQDLKPGMPAEAIIQTGERTALAYMAQPIIESMNRAWREE